MGMNVLVTGGAGFIGSHLVDALVEAGHRVVVMDNLDPGVHGGRRPPYLNPRATYLFEDIRNPKAVRKGLDGAEVVYHLASLIDVAESMKEPAKYVDTNVNGTATLLDQATKQREVRRLILSSSVAVYGEGLYVCPSCGPAEPGPRAQELLEKRRWEVPCPSCGGDLKPRATSEKERPDPGSIYGLTKLVQEKLFESAGISLDIPAFILRYANVYGPRQRPGPYAGVCATFLERLREGQPLIIHEDGLQTRDLVHVHDVVRASVLAMRREAIGVQIANIGTGKPITILEIAEVMRDLTGRDSPLNLEKTFRPGDIRHLWVETEEAAKGLNFKPSIGFEEGIAALISPH